MVGCFGSQLGFAGRGLVDFDGAVQAEGLVRTDVVEDLPVGLGLAGQRRQVGDLQPVVFVLERPERPFPHPVLTWALAAGGYVEQLGPGGEERGERLPLERPAVEFLTGVKPRRAF
jgi:hypothetical protein